MLKRIILILLCFVFTNFSFAGPAGPAVPSAWTNQYGSTLYIQDVDSLGKISGYYVNNDTNYSCVGTPYPVVGWIYDSEIVFSTKWDNATEACHSITAWVGIMTSEKVFSASWQLITDEGKLLSGHDFFQLSSTNEAHIKK